MDAPRRKRDQKQKAANADGAPPCKALNTERFAGRRVVEEVVEEEEETYVLVRFPCFDYFTNVHLCEEGSDSQGTAPPDWNGHFRPEDTFHFLPGTMSTAHPHLVVNPGHGDCEMAFRGIWDDKETLADSSTLTNRAVLKLGLAPQRHRAGKARAAADALGTGAAQQSSLGVSSASVQSLMPHAEDGLTADEVRARTLAEDRAISWQYDGIIVPSAVLVMHRYK